MTQEIDWHDLEYIPNYGRETQLMTLVSEKPNGNAFWDLFNAFTEKWGVEITNKNVITYHDTNLEHEMGEVKMKKIKALYLNSNFDQLLIYTPSVPHEIIYSKLAVEAAKKILAIKVKDEIPVYELLDKDLQEWQDDEELPDDDYIANAHSGSTRESSEEEKPDRYSYKGIKKNKNRPRRAAGEQSHQSIDDNFDSEYENDRVDSENNRLNREKSVCLIKPEVTLDNFTLLTVIGKGAFGRVFLAKDNTNNEVLAMKRIRKDKVLKSGSVENILLEKKILSEINHPLLLSIRHVFSSKYRFYFFTDYIIGGDLMRHLKKTKSGFTLSQVKFIAAQLVLAFQCLHDNGFVHRDLKPENVLIDEEGYIRLADFGLAKDLTESEGTGSCGTLEYMAPEIVETSGKHNYEVDWWTLGIIMYELYYCKTPFLAGTREEILENITEMPLEFPDDDEDNENKNLKNFKNLIRKLLVKDPKKRLGRSRRKQGAKKVKRHPFFRNVAWAKILDRTYESPYIPQINTDKIKKYLKKKGVKVGTSRAQANSKLGETELNTSIKKKVERDRSKFDGEFEEFDI